MTCTVERFLCVAIMVLVVVFNDLTFIAFPQVTFSSFKDGFVRKLKYS